MRFSRHLLNPAGIVLAGASFALAVATLAGSGPTSGWTGREALLIAWGIFAYVGTVLLKSFPGSSPRALGSSPPAEPLRPSPGPPSDLIPLTEEALRHLNDPRGLAECALATSLPNTLAAVWQERGSTAGQTLTPLESAGFLQGVLKASIKQLGDSSLQYFILWEEYVENRPNVQIMTRHYVAERAFFRERRRAIEALASELAAQEARLTKP